jgi:hypothetical protein
MGASSEGKREYGGQSKMSKVLGAFGLLDFTVLRPVLCILKLMNRLFI